MLATGVAERLFPLEETELIAGLIYSGMRRSTTQRSVRKRSTV